MKLFPSTQNKGGVTSAETQTLSQTFLHSYLSWQRSATVFNHTNTQEIPLALSDFCATLLVLFLSTFDSTHVGRNPAKHLEGLVDEDNNTMVMITMYFCSLTDIEDKARIRLPQLIYSDSCAVTSGISLCSCKYGAYANTGDNWWWWCEALWEGLSVGSWLMEIFACSCLSSLKGFQQPSVHMQSKPSANASLL